MPALTKDAINNVLKSVLDPELKINIVDLGLIYRTEVESQVPPKIKIVMTLTTPGCPLGTAFVRMIRDALAQFEGVNPERDVIIDIVFDPPWTQDMMSEEAKAELGF